MFLIVLVLGPILGGRNFRWLNRLPLWWAVSMVTALKGIYNS